MPAPGVVRSDVVNYASFREAWPIPRAAHLAVWIPPLAYCHYDIFPLTLISSATGADGTFFPIFIRSYGTDGAHPAAAALIPIRRKELSDQISMKETLVRTILAALFFLVCSGFTQAREAFTGPDLSGVYACQGDDSHEGKYTAIATLQLIPEQSLGKNGAYVFKLEVPGYGTYPGHAATQGTTAAIYFANTDPSTKDFGTGIASFRKNNNGKWTFKKFYYEPEFKGGNYGFELCTQK